MPGACLNSRTLGLIGAATFGVLLGGLLFLLISQPRGHPVQLLPPPTPAPIRVHVAGAVRNPGVLELEPGAIVQDALRAAGGVLPEAQLDDLNLAAGLHDGQRVFVPSVGEQTASILAQGPLVPINSASAPQLEQLPGIGPVLAQNIVDHRERYGPFQRLEDLLEVDGIGPAKLEAIRELVQVP